MLSELAAVAAGSLDDFRAFRAFLPGRWRIAGPQKIIFH
jgi:hypothetical protein